jgi:hypothetical protein
MFFPPASTRELFWFGHILPEELNLIAMGAVTPEKPHQYMASDETTNGVFEATGIIDDHSSPWIRGRELSYLRFGDGFHIVVG